MHFHVVDAYIDESSIVHRLDPRAKVLVVFLLILTISLTPTGAFAVYLGYFALMMVGTVAARIDPMLVVKRSLIALPFAGAAVTLIFTLPGPVLGTVPLVGWGISAPGVIRFASILFKSMISVQAATLLVASTHFTDMLWALSALHIPKVLVAILSFMYRYIFVLVEEAVRLTRARDSRSASLSGKPPSLLFRMRTTGRLVGSLLVRSFERSERVYQAMVARGYHGEMLVINPPRITRQDFVIAIIPLFLAAILLVVSLL